MPPDAVNVRPEPVRLAYHTSANRDVVVTPADHDRFVLSIKAAINACQAYHDQLEFQEQFENRLLPRLAGWLTKHKVAVECAYVTVREDGLFFVVVQAEAVHDRALEDAVAALDIEIATDPGLKLISLSTMTLPSASPALYRSFLAPEHTLAYHAE